jgi:hypothetical protein
LPGKNVAINSPFYFGIPDVLDSIRGRKNHAVPVDRNDLVSANVVSVGFSNY